MKRICAFALILLVLFSGLTACGLWVSDEYRSVTPHSEEPYTEPEPTEEEPPPTVHDREELRSAVLSMITDWAEHSVILVEDYDGDIADDLAQAVQYATREDPVGAYAVDYADAELTGGADAGSIALNIVFRRSAAEINSIAAVSNDEGACSKIIEVLTNYAPALTVRIRTYGQTDFVSFIRSYCIEHPEKILALPDLSAQVYPETGQTRIVELHFLYPDTREEMRVKQDAVNTILTSASNYVRARTDDAERVERLFRFLATRFSYTLCEDDPVTPAYSLLCEGKAHSLSFASVFFAECRSAQIDCRIIQGERGGAVHYWNMILLDGQYYYVDLMRAIEQVAYDPALLTTQELEAEGYVWDRTDLPDTPLPTEPTAPTEAASDPTAPTAKPSTEEPTESTEPTEPTEPTDAPTEPTESPDESDVPGSRR
ncbi:MAG: transglutaminase domain-containing protein [Oscillospiraceae bacterium]|nr:transglutaminase domain-containing protein [Oscillospiraceae bacterium]